MRCATMPIAAERFAVTAFRYLIGNRTSCQPVVPHQQCNMGGQLPHVAESARRAIETFCDLRDTLYYTYLNTDPAAPGCQQRVPGGAELARANPS
jgi:hypothetical protein